MNYDELKELVLKKIEEYPQYKQRALQELMRAKIAYENNINIVDEISKLKEANELSDGYILPFFLGEISEPEELKPIELVQTRPGGAGGLDVDVDLSSAGKPILKAHLEEKYGKDRVISVGTYSTIGLASAIRDILRREQVPFKDVNAFCAELDPDLSFEENMNNYRQNHKNLYDFYLAHKAGLSFVPKICNIYRACIPYYEKVETYSGDKEIKELSPEKDKIAYLNKDGKKCYTNNYNVFYKGVKKVYEITLSDGRKVRATEEHKFFTSNGIKKLSELKYWDKLIVKT